MKKMRVGVVGAGYLGKFHAEKYSQMDDVELVGVADIDEQQATKVAKNVNAKAYKNYHDLIGKVEAVSIVVPTHAHFSISKDFLENDIDVLIEKPVTTTLEQADELIRISETRGLIIQVGHLERFNPAVLALKKIVGNPRFIESHRLSTFKERGTDVSVVLDLMIHDIDIISSLVKSEIKNIHAAGTAIITDQVDIANTRMEFENGCVANVTASRISTKNERKTRLFQRDAYISVDFANHEISIISKNSEEQNSIIPGMEIKNLCFTKGDALRDELAAFVKAVKMREEPDVTGQVGRNALKVALSIMEQIEYSKKHLIDR
ncbi:Gfo/Idh/MocA family oxidoreductase [Desulfobacterium sp. N47]|uniref:Gfo/Idh/MocA family oxidoreductase n=1 Tax=Desulfobacterium sp. N47 TaxID=3115210 RepID=UPI003C9C5A3E